MVFGALILIIGLLVLEKRIDSEGFQDSNIGSYSFPEGIALINLDRRTDRLKSFTDSFNESDAKDRLQFKRFSAVDAKKIEIEKYITPQAYSDIQTNRRRMGKNRINGRDIGLGLTRGGVGCYMSHIEVLKFIASQDKPWIVCEDDTKIPTDFAKRITEVLPKVPYKENAMILFHAICSSPAMHAKALQCEPIGNGISTTNQFWSLACFYILPSTARAILEFAAMPPYDMEIDAKISDLAQLDGIKVYVAQIVRTGWNDTDIQMSSNYYKAGDM